MSYSGYDSTILQWAVNRHLLHADGTAQRTTPLAQAGKTLEELGEADEALRLENCSQLATEFGDVLFTLALQSFMHGSNLEQCKTAIVSLPDLNWQRWPHHFEQFRASVAQNLPDLPQRIGSLILCVEDGARFYCQKTGEECLMEAIAKNQNRSGVVKDGVFVKDSDRGSGR